MIGIEKPTLVNPGAPLLLRLNNDPGWVGQVKLNEHRSIITVGSTCLVKGWRGNTFFGNFPLRARRNLELDGGVLRTKTFKARPVLYLFDVLRIDGEKTSLTYAERLKLLRASVEESSQVVVVRDLTDWLTEFSTGSEREVARIAELTGRPVSEIAAINEGLVIKNLHSKLSYPRTAVACSWQLKLKY
jgi:hypothetical protein